MKRILDNDSISPRLKHFQSDITCLFDLPIEILLMICRYLSIYDIFHCFYTPSNPEFRLHYLISDYYTKLSLGGLKYNELNYLIQLLKDSIRPSSLKLRNTEISYLIEYYFKSIERNELQSIFNNLINLSLFDCLSKDLSLLIPYLEYLTKLEYLHLSIRDDDDKEELYFEEKYDVHLNRILFNNRLSSVERIDIKSFNGLSLYKCLIPHENLRYVRISLHTIDDLYILINGLIPNIQILIVQLEQKRLLSNYFESNLSNYLCSKLIDFTLFDNSTELIIDHLQLIFNSMSNLNKLTLSIRNTNDPLFCHGRNFESILNKSFPNLRQFNYSITHRITDKTIIEDFIRWPMNYSKENNQLIHIYSLPYDDRREFLIIDGKPIQFPSRITKLILNKETPVGSIEQPSIRHLIIKRRLIDENEIDQIHHQYPNVKYLELLFPLDSKKFSCCLKTLFNLNETNNQRYYWKDLIHFRTICRFQQSSIFSDGQFRHWLISNTDLKFDTNIFVVNVKELILSIWF